MTETVWLQRPSADVPWGFRLYGGRDLQQPLCVQRVTPGSVASTGLGTGDAILRIDDTDANMLTYAQSQELIKTCGNLLQLVIAKKGSSAAEQSSQRQVYDSVNHGGGTMHDLFDDMYRSSEHVQGTPQSSGYGSRPSQTYYQNNGRQVNSRGAHDSQYRGMLNDPGRAPNRPTVSIPVSHDASPVYTKTVSTPYRNYSSPQQKDSRRYPGTSYNSAPSTPVKTPDVPLVVRGTYSVQQPDHMQSDERYRADAANSVNDWLPPPPTEQYVLQPPSGGTVSRGGRDGVALRQRSFEQPLSPPLPLAANGPPQMTALPPPPPPPLPSSSGGTKTDRGGQFPTKLERQLSDLALGTFSPPPPPPPAEYNGYDSRPPAPPMDNYTTSPSSARPPFGGMPPSPQREMPDAVLSMAAKSGSDKKPWSYAPDASVLAEQRNRVRRKPQGASLPKYQNMLGMPNFNESPPPRAPQPAPPLNSSPHQPVTPPVGDGEAVVAHLQYNSPLGLYSGDNVQEAFTGQTGLEIGSVSGLNNQSKEQNDITQSAVYRMIHGLDNAPKNRGRPVPLQSGPKVEVVRPDNDELSFSGVNRGDDIPSKAFQRLQKMTSNDAEIDTTSIRPRCDDADVDEVSAYDETSIRYRGRNIPSKSFKMLQNMTGPCGPNLTVPGANRRVRKPNPSMTPTDTSDGVPDNADDIVDISYVGGHIPSRSFRFLQKSIGETDGGENESDMSGNSTVKVIHIRPAANQQPSEDDSATDF